MIRRPVVVKLAVPDERRVGLRKTTERFQQAAQLVADRAFERDDAASDREVDAARKQLPVPDPFGIVFESPEEA